MKCRRIGILLLTACCLAVATVPLSAQEYRVVELGTLGGPDTMALAISDNGIVSGLAMLPSGEWRAVIWARAPSAGARLRYS